MSEINRSKQGVIERVTGTDAANLGLDEIVADGCGIHIERMSDTSIWFNIWCGSSRNLKNLSGFFAVKDKKLQVTIQETPHDRH